jgi:hypothetical protein
LACILSPIKYKEKKRASQSKANHKVQGVKLRDMVDCWRRGMNQEPGVWPNRMLVRTYEGCQ